MIDYFLYIKPTNKCQLQCKHCYTNSTIKDNDKLDIDKAIMFINKFCNEHKEDNIIASLHGGEPFVADFDDNYRLVSETIHNNNIFWSATTNLIYELNDQYIELFNKFIQPNGNKIVLTSYDLFIRFNEKQEELWKNNVKKIISKGIDVKPIVSFTNYLNAENVKMIFNTFIELGIKSMNFERITESGRAIQNPLRYKNDKLDDVLYDVYMLWNNEYRDKLSITLFEDIELAFEKQILVGCRARKCMSRVITINPNGSISGCPNQSDKTYDSITGDNSVITDELKKLQCKEMNIDKRCYGCKYFKYCNGDCFQLKWDNDICPAPRKIYEYLYNKKES